MIQEIKAIISSKEKPLAIISDSMVGKLYGNQLKEELTNEGYTAFLFTFPEGEAYKTRATKEKLEDALLEKKLGSDTVIIAFGGGVVTDIAGFIAATYCRGVPYITIPTTLLAMCDSSIGGKNGVNCRFGKNLIGTFYEPIKTILDFNFLSSLTLKNIREGLAEVIKHSLIHSSSFFKFLEKNSEAILNLEKAPIAHLVEESIRIKTKIVKESHKVKEKRNLLNFGHTVAHALEVASDFTISHGEAVAFGILAECKMSLLLNILQKEDYIRIEKILVGYGFTLSYPNISFSALLTNMKLDKKSLNGNPRFVILQKIGACSSSQDEYCEVIDPVIIKTAVIPFDWSL